MPRQTKPADPQRHQILRDERYNCEFCWTSFRSERELHEHLPRCDGTGYCLCHIERNIFYHQPVYAKR
jgi:hypothetical protein